ncbi:MAG: hypothetical protein A2Y15_02165 [Clostridiales bacterium GWF2_36_10]|nr:MAG: hypothetical protein A2Y15_02165 [Clostridiales bacterium GWF2_36_10]HAN21713.1 hypothetical protein [Clostridiales bacterium]
MAQFTYVQAIKIYDNIEKNIGKNAADDFTLKLPLSKSADYKRKFKWAADVCKYLEDTYTPKQIRKIRMSCSYGTSEKEMVYTKRLFDQAADLGEFCSSYNIEYTGQHTMRCEGEILYLSYPTCYCSCVKRVNETLLKTWCLCTLGYTKKLFDFTLSYETKSSLLRA